MAQEQPAVQRQSKSGLGLSGDQESLLGYAGERMGLDFRFSFANNVERCMHSLVLEENALWP